MGWRRTRRLGAAVLAALALVSTANAQSVVSNSSQNVVPSASAQSVAELQAQRKVLFARMLQNPADLDAAFKYAELSMRVGDLESAISTLERMLIFSPGLPRLQLELGVLYFRLGAYDTAGSYFKAVLAAPGVPADIQSQIAMYLSAIDQRSRGAGFSAVVTTGVRYQTNANAGPASNIVNLNGIDFILNPGATSQPDANGFVTANMRASVDLEGQGTRLDANVSAYGAIYQNQTSLNTGAVEVRIGPTFNLAQVGIENASLGIQGIASAAVLGGELYTGAIGAGANLTKVLDARSRIVVQSAARYEQFLNTTLRPNSALRSGQRYNGSVTYEYQATANLGLFATAGAERRIAQTGYLSNWSFNATVGAIFSFDSPIEALQGGPWTLSVSGGVRRTMADAPDTVFSPTNAELAHVAFVQGALTVPLANGYAVQTTASYAVSTSNYAFGNYTNLGGSVGISKGF